MTTLGVRVTQLVMAGVAAVNIATMESAPTGGTEDFLAWIVRGALTGGMLLLVWLFNKTADVIRNVQDEQDEQHERLRTLEFMLDIDERTINLGRHARRRGGVQRKPQAEEKIP